jgi:hypothetical protein
MRLLLFLLCISWVVSLIGCGAQARPTAPPPAVTPSATARVVATIAPPTSPPATPSPAARSTPTAAPGKPSAAATGGGPTATAPAPSGQRFRVDQRSRSGQPALKDVALAVHYAVLSPTTLTLRVAFENTTDRAFSLTGSLTERDVTLADAAGARQQPTSISSGWRRIDPPGGFAPGGANVGEVTFPRLPGGEPYEFGVTAFEPVRFRLDAPVPAATPPAVATGEYRVGASPHATERALAPIAFRVQSIRVAADGLTFGAAFVNTSRDSYGLTSGPKGGDAWLLDAEGAQYRPRAVSDSFKDAIAPRQGWQPGQEYVGTLTFPRPGTLQEVRLLFPGYAALAVRFDATGVAEARVVSATGGAPPPTPTPRADDVARDELGRLLTQQAGALLANDAATYLATFAPGLRPAQEQVVKRVAQAPLASYAMEVAPDANLTAAASGALKRVEVEVHTTLRDIPANNRFVNTLYYDFTRADGRWQVSAVAHGDSPPFWLTGDVVAHSTDHFLVFTRPQVADQLPELTREVESAYAALARQGLPLEPRYVAYFAATQQDFRELTGKGQRYLGVASARYDLRSDAIGVFSRAFYINSDAFSQQRRPLPPGERQRTVTHELVHLALAPDTRPFTPPWLAEGAAVHFAGQNTPDERRHLLDGGRLDQLSLEKLTRASTLGEHDVQGERVGDEYALSGEVVAYLVDTFGADTFLAFYRSYGQVSSAQVRDKLPRFASAIAAQGAFADLSAQLTTDAAQRFFGVTLATLEADVKAWARSRKP